MSVQRKRQKWSRSTKQPAVTVQANGIDFVSCLFSKELVLKVFSFLSCRDLVQCAVVSMNWSRMANDEMLWKPLFMNRFRDPGFKQSTMNDKRSRRSSATKYGGSWKMKYRIHHNWLQGNCDISNILDIPNGAVNNNSNNSQHHLQFSHDTLFIAQSFNSIVDVWKYNGTIRPPGIICQLQAVDLVSDACSTSITCLKLVEKSTNPGYLVAGYSNGGFTLWTITDSITETVTYFPTKRSTSKVTSIGFDYPMILIYTKDMQLSVFHMDSITGQLQLLHHLQSPVDWAPVVIDMHRSKGKKKSLWKIIVCFGLFASTTGTANTSVGIQEIVLSSQSVLSSTQGFVIDHEPLIPSGLASNTPRHALSERITAMSYSPPYLITAHANNTMKQYIVATAHNGRLDIRFQQTLYGHTFNVDALAVNQHKLVSGDRSGIKVWDLQAPGECKITLHSFRDQSNMNELPDACIETLGFDEDKIVAIVRVKEASTSLVRTWSFT